MALDIVRQRSLIDEVKTLKKAYTAKGGKKPCDHYTDEMWEQLLSHIDKALLAAYEARQDEDLLKVTDHLKSVREIFLTAHKEQHDQIHKMMNEEMGPPMFVVVGMMTPPQMEASHPAVARSFEKAKKDGHLN